MKSDFLESNLENAGFSEDTARPLRALPWPTGEGLELCRPQAVPRAAEPPANLSQAPETSNQQPWGSWVIPVTAVTTDSNLDDTCTFPGKKNSDPAHLNISLLQEVLSVQSLQLAPSVYLRVLLKTVLMLICIIQMPYNSCLMMTSVVLYVKSETSK